jgi:hypothetical protein
LAVQAWHLGRGRAPSGRLRFARVALALGPPAHAAGQAMGLLIFWAVLALVLGLLQQRGVLQLGERMPRGLGNVCFGGLAYLATVLQHMRHALLNTRQEQALATLWPGVPRGGALNRALAAHLLRHFLGMWLLVFGPLGWLLWPVPAAFMQALAFGGVALALGVLVLTGPLGALRPSPGWMVVRLYLLPMAAAGAALGLMLLGWLDPRWWVAGLLCSGVAWLAWRWWRLGQAPTPWPVGRR